MQSILMRLIAMLMLLVVVLLTLSSHRTQQTHGSDALGTFQYAHTYAVTKSGCSEQHNFEAVDTINMKIDGVSITAWTNTELSATFCGKTQNFAAVRGVIFYVTLWVHPNFSVK